jgi:hypothetical protein
MLLLDTTGSMNFQNSDTDETARRDIVHEAISQIVIELEKHDSQNESEGGEGGLRTVTFANGQAFDLGDLNSKNLKTKWSEIKWSGSTYIIPGWQKLLEVYEEEFCEEEVKPLMMILVITDGEATDLAEFIATLEDNVQAYFTIALLGSGEEYENTFRSFWSLYQVQPDLIRQTHPF